MKLRKLFAVGVLLTFFAHVAGAGNLDIRRKMLFNGDAATGTASIDTTEHASPWIDVRGASRILLRSWSAKAAFHVSTDADSLYTDTITVFRIAFSDSMASTNPLVAGDSVIYTSAAYDTNIAQVNIGAPPVNQQLRGPGNGSGIYSWVMPTTPNAITVDVNGFIPKQYMRVYYTPLARNTAATGLATAPNRANRGLKFFRMEALVIYPNR